MAVDLPNSFTVLTITGLGEAPYASRGMSMSMEPIPQAAQLRRTITGRIVDLSETQFRLYRGTITGRDQKAPAFGGLWPSGTPYEIEALAEIGNGTLASDVPAVTGSTYTEDGITYFRPKFWAVFTGLSWETDEYAAQVAWSLSFEQVPEPVV